MLAGMFPWFQISFSKLVDALVLLKTRVTYDLGKRNKVIGGAECHYKSLVVVACMFL